MQTEINTIFTHFQCNLFFFKQKPFKTRMCTIKQDITQSRSDSAGQMSGKKIKPVYKWYTVGPDEDKILRPGTESLAELCCTGSYFKVVFPAVEVASLCFGSWLSGRYFNVATWFLGFTIIPHCVCSLKIWIQTVTLWYITFLHQNI